MKQFIYFFRKVDMLGDLDRRLNKVLKELDINNLIKLVKSKADIV